MSQAQPEAVRPLTEAEIEQHQQHYNEENFWSKLTNYARSAGSKVVEKSLTLYYTAASPKTPLWAKTLIFSALGYFIFPIDAIPDFLPVIGYSDDLVTLGTAVTAVAAHMSPEHTDKAKEMMKKWFGKEQKE
jgi:uncharacterized membrane protein YkvA (DUF1232 family)